MFNRRKLDRERLEIYLVHLLLAWRPLVFVCGGLLLAYALALLPRSLPAAVVLALVSALPLLLGISYNAVVYTARLGAWVATLGRRE